MNKRILISSLTGLILGLMFSFSAAAEISVQSNQMAANNPAIETPAESIKTSDIIGKNDLKELELKLQEKILATDQKVVENQQETINWWLALIALMSVAVPYLFYKQARERMLVEFNTILDQAKKSASNAQAHLDEIQSFHSQAKERTNEIAKLSEQMKKYSSQAQDQESKQQKESIKAARDLAEHSNIPLIEQLRAKAILLSDKANHSQNYQDHLQAFYAWQAVLQQDSQDNQANFNIGLQACYLHEKGNREQQVHWLPEVEKHYQKTLFIIPDECNAAYNWGTALLREALALDKQNNTEATFEVLRNAEEKLQLALDIQPDMYDSAYHWGLVLSTKAQVLAAQKNTTSAFEAWRRAENKFQTALDIKPDNYKAAYAWGNVLNNEAKALAKQNNTEAAFKKWHKAGEKYRLALDIKPDMYEAANNWGAALAAEAQALAEQGDTATALEKWREAGEKYQRALAIKPDMHEAANNWLTCLLHEYHALKDNQPAEAQTKLQQARDLVNDFLSQNPQRKEYLAYDHACLCALEGNAAEAVKQLRFAQQIDDLPDKDHIQTDPDFDNIRHTPEFQAWFKEAFPESSSKS